MAKAGAELLAVVAELVVQAVVAAVVQQVIFSLNTKVYKIHGKSWCAIFGNILLIQCMEIPNF